MSSHTSGAAKPLKIAMVGCGFIGRRHANVVNSLDSVEISVLIDPVAERADAVSLIVTDAGNAAPARADTLAQALDDNDVDIVVICSPTGYHSDLAVQALEAGKHILIEKPLDVNLLAAGKVVAAANNNKSLVAAVISQHRFDPASVVVHDAATSGRLGTITSGVVVGSLWRTQEYYDSGDWRGTWALDGGGALMNQGVHTVDLLVWFLGRPVEVYARTALLAHENVEVEDTAVATITFESGALATLLYTTAAYPGLTPRIHVHGSNGSAVIDGERLQYFHEALEGDVVDAYGSGAAGNTAETMTPPADEHELGYDVLVAGHRRQYVDFLSAITDGTTPRVGVQDAFTSLALVRAVYASAELGEPVLFDDVIAGKYEKKAVKA